ncbi:MAG TPA: glycosyltransferase family 4 protein [Anaerolineae bacterium]|nr:glycosyltransferase family 4 protein [Anaerolineae bacterium]HNU04359.1 glycosyltransferase family 4 protein [Anaerolineae bacterium]
MNIAFISTRIAGVDGVSLEIAKLAMILRRLGHHCCFCAGELDASFAPGFLVPEMHFTHPEALWIHDHCFGTTEAAPGLRERIEAQAARLHTAIARFVDEQRVDVLFTQNALSIPMQVPLGVALTDFIAATAIPTLAHNHDLAWERERFAVNCIPDLLERCFPPALPSVQHLVINSLAQTALRERKGVEAVLLPNIFDFAAAAPAMTPFNADLRANLGLTDDHLLILQPTRVIPRKGIELAIELVRRLREPQNRRRLLGKEPVLVISHYAGDEGLAYLAKLHALASAAGAPLIYAAEHFAAEPGVTGGRKVYSLWDGYVHADFVAYPSLIEGFGNALLETLYFRLPALVNRYAVYTADIAPRGFDLIEIDAQNDPGNLAAITDETVDATICAITDPVRRRRMVEWNYQRARESYSFEAVTPLLASLLQGLAH